MNVINYHYNYSQLQLPTTITTTLVTSNSEDIYVKLSMYVYVGIVFTCSTLLLFPYPVPADIHGSVQHVTLDFVPMDVLLRLLKWFSQAKHFECRYICPPQEVQCVHMYSASWDVLVICTNHYLTETGCELGGEGEGEGVWGGSWGELEKAVWGAVWVLWPSIAGKVVRGRCARGGAVHVGENCMGKLWERGCCPAVWGQLCGKLCRVELCGGKLCGGEVYGGAVWGTVCGSCVGNCVWELCGARTGKPSYTCIRSLKGDGKSCASLDLVRIYFTTPT